MVFFIFKIFHGLMGIMTQSFSQLLMQLQQMESFHRQFHHFTVQYLNIPFRLMMKLLHGFKTNTIHL